MAPLSPSMELQNREHKNHEYKQAEYMAQNDEKFKYARNSYLSSIPASQDNSNYKHYAYLSQNEIDPISLSNVNSSNPVNQFPLPPKSGVADTNPNMMRMFDSQNLKNRNSANDINELNQRKQYKEIEKKYNSHGHQLEDKYKDLLSNIQRISKSIQQVKTQNQKLEEEIFELHEIQNDSIIQNKQI